MTPIWKSEKRKYRKWFANKFEYNYEYIKILDEDTSLKHQTKSYVFYDPEVMHPSTRKGVSHAVKKFYLGKIGNDHNICGTSFGLWESKKNRKATMAKIFPVVILPCDQKGSYSRKRTYIIYRKSAKLGFMKHYNQAYIRKVIQRGMQNEQQ